MVKDIFIGVLVAADIVATFYDVSKTEEGLKKGVGVEGNAVVTSLFGLKPGTLQLDLWNWAFTGVITALALYPYANPNVVAAAVGMCSLTLAVDAVKHYLGGRMWSTLLKGGKLKVDRTAWEKFLGLGVTLA